MGKAAIMAMYYHRKGDKAAAHKEKQDPMMMLGHMDEQTAKDWTQHMTTPEDRAKRGEHWTMAQTTQVLKQSGLSFDPVEFYAVMNMMYSDYYCAAKKFGLEKNADFFVELSKAWLEDDDVMAGKNKTMMYYHYIVK